MAYKPSAELLIYRNIDLQNGTGPNIKATGGILYGYYLFNNNAAVRYVKLYNEAAATAASTPVMTIGIPPGAAANVSFPQGIVFRTAISIRGVTGVADADNTAPTANDLVVNIFYL